MNMKKLLVLLTLGIVALVASPVVAVADDEQAAGSLNAINFSGGNYVPLDKFRTISIRDGRDNALLACGLVVVHGTSGEARLHNVATPPSGITAVINFLDDGINLYIVGTATGMDPGTPYVSLIYDKTSVPSGIPGLGMPPPCVPTIRDLGDDDIRSTMFVGSWAVLPGEDDDDDDDDD